MLIKKRLLFFAFLLFVFSVSLFAASEKEWQEAWNDAYARGKLEVSVTFGRVDILTDEYAIEVDHVHKFHEGDRKSTRLNSSHIPLSRMPSSA